MTRLTKAPDADFTRWLYVDAICGAKCTLPPSVALVAENTGLIVKVLSLKKEAWRWVPEKLALQPMADLVTLYVMLKNTEARNVVS